MLKNDLEKKSFILDEDDIKEFKKMRELLKKIPFFCITINYLKN
jgi:hypothetical protein